MDPSDCYRSFIQKYPNYLSTLSLDDLRQNDYSRLDANGHVYLDYTGSGLYGESQIIKHMQLLTTGVFGNPHSSNPTSYAATELIESTRKAVLRFFNASEEDYVVIFTSNASGALKLVGESYPFAKGGHYLLTFDNHNSVNGIREYAMARGSEVTYIPMVLPQMTIDEEKLQSSLELAKPGQANLFAYPAQSNFSGRQHSLEWIEQAHAKGWDVLLDVAAYAPTNPLDLSRYPADFVPISFYKMFGYPTGLGALIARRKTLGKLQRPWFAGGTITVASVQGEKHYMADAPNAFEDGTLNFLGIPAVEIGLNHISSIGLENIHNRVHDLTAYWLAELPGIKHANGRPVLKIYGSLDAENHGGTIALNFIDADGRVIDHRFVEERANQVKISLRTGCFCNPGAGEMALGISSSELQTCFRRPSHETHLSYDEFRLCIDGKASGAVRISVGMVSNFADVYAFITFAKSLAQ
jgi:selenocysteine lyase/cysteine desulfurase